MIMTPTNKALTGVLVLALGFLVYKKKFAKAKR